MIQRYKVEAFISGFSSVFSTIDIVNFPNLSFPNLSKGFEKDKEALRKDWICIGYDLRKSMDVIMHGK